MVLPDQQASISMHAKHNQIVILGVLGRQLTLLKFCCMHTKHNKAVLVGVLRGQLMLLGRC